MAGLWSAWIGKTEMKKPPLYGDEPRCLICGTTLDLHVHHIYPGSGRRDVSDREGCWCYLCARHHNMSDAGVHFNRRLDMELRRDCQRRWEKREGAGHDEFRALFGCSYL